MHWRNSMKGGKKNHTLFEILVTFPEDFPLWMKRRWSTMKFLAFFFSPSMSHSYWQRACFAINIHRWCCMQSINYFCDKEMRRKHRTYRMLVRLSCHFLRNRQRMWFSLDSYVSISIYGVRVRQLLRYRMEKMPINMNDARFEFSKSSFNGPPGFLKMRRVWGHCRSIRLVTVGEVVNEALDVIFGG